MPRLHQRRTRYTRTPSQRVYTSTKTSAGTVATTNVTGGESSTESSQLSANIPTPDFTGSAGMVALTSTALLMFATWDQFWSPMFQSLWTGNSFSGGTSWNMVLSGFVAIGVLSVIASQSDDAAGVIQLAIIAMWLVFIVMNAGNSKSTFNKFLNFVNPSAYGGGAGATFGNTSTVVPNPSSGYGGGSFSTFGNTSTSGSGTSKKPANVR